MTTSSKRAIAIAALGLAALSAAPSAQAQPAQPSAADLESARELYKEGKALRDKGDLKGALKRFKAAHAYGQTPVTGLELGKTHIALGELVEAREVLLSVGRTKVASDETEKSAAARTEAADLAEQLRGKIPTLTVKVTGVPEGTAIQILVDGALVPAVGLGAIRKTNPGSHTVIVRASGKEASRPATLKEGESAEVVVSMEGASAAPTGPTGPTGPGPTGPGGPTDGSKPAPDGGGRKIHVLTWIGAGVGVAGVGVGTVTGLMALSKASKVDSACANKVCPTSAKSDVDSGRTLATVSTIGYIAGGVGVAAAAVGFFVLSKPASAGAAPARVQVVAGPSYLGLDGRF